MSFSVVGSNSLVPDVILNEAVGQVVRYNNKELAIDYIKGCDLSSEHVFKIEQIFKEFNLNGSYLEAQVLLKNRILEVLKTEAQALQILSIDETDYPCSSQCYLDSLDITDQIFAQCISRGDFTDILALGCTNVCIALYINYLAAGINLKQLCPKLTIWDAKALEFVVDDEPPLSNLVALKCFGKFAFRVKNNAGITILTVPKDLTIKQLIADAEKAGINIWMLSDKILEQLGGHSAKETYRIVITNARVTGTRNKLFKAQAWWMHHIGFDGMPHFEELLLFRISMLKINKLAISADEQKMYARTFTIIGGHPVVIGRRGQNRLAVGLMTLDLPTSRIGAGGRKRL